MARPEKHIGRYMAKGLRAPSKEIVAGPAWVVARRGWLYVFADRLQCGDWTIPYSKVTSCELARIPGFPLPGKVLVVDSEDGIYQFGLNPWARIEKKLPIASTVRKGSIHLSAFSVVVRLVLLALLLAWIFGALDAKH